MKRSVLMLPVVTKIQGSKMEFSGSLGHDRVHDCRDIAHLEWHDSGDLLMVMDISGFISLWEREVSVLLRLSGKTAFFRPLSTHSPLSRRFSRRQALLSRPHSCDRVVKYDHGTLAPISRLLLLIACVEQRQHF
jgi:hypothetical protein